MTLFRNATLVDATDIQARTGFDVLVEDDRIKEVSDTPITASDAREIDLKGATLMPGLIDAHVHVKATDLNLALLGVKPSSYMGCSSGASPPSATPPEPTKASPMRWITG